MPSLIHLNGCTSQRFMWETASSAGWEASSSYYLMTIGIQPMAHLPAPSGLEVLTTLKLNNTGCVMAKPLNICLTSVQMIMALRALGC